MATRHQVRECVVGLLYAHELGNDNIVNIIDDMLEDKKIRNKQKDFAKLLFNGVLDNKEAIDNKIISQLNEHYSFERIGNIEKSILRLGVYEILFSEVDEAVIINEAIEITKDIGNENSSKFVNGVLDSIKRG